MDKIFKSEIFNILSFIIQSVLKHFNINVSKSNCENLILGNKISFTLNIANSSLGHGWIIFDGKLSSNVFSLILEVM